MKKEGRKKERKSLSYISTRGNLGLPVSAQVEAKSETRQDIGCRKRMPYKEWEIGSEKYPLVHSISNYSSLRERSWSGTLWGNKII